MPNVQAKDMGPAGCSKSLRFSPTQPRRAKTRRSADKAAASEDRRRYPPHFVGPFAHSMDLGERKTPPVLPISEGLLFNVEDLSDARTTHGNRRVSARLGWAGEKSGFFSILPENYLRVRTDWSAKLTSGLGKRPNRITPATAQANTKDKAGEVTRRGGATEEGFGSRIYMTITTRM